MTPIKILFIIDCYKDPYAGTEGQLRHLIHTLDDKRFQPTLVILRDTYYQKYNQFHIPVDVLNIKGISVSIF